VSFFLPDHVSQPQGSQARLIASNVGMIKGVFCLGAGVLPSLLAMQLAGEGAYILVVCVLTYIGLIFVAERIRRKAPVGSEAKSLSLWVIVPSAAFVVVLSCAALFELLA